jgi:hypothetical protein
VTPDYAVEVRELFNRGCTCGGIDIGVGQIHEPQCGFPTPDDIAALAKRMYEQGFEDGARPTKSIRELCEEHGIRVKDSSTLVDEITGKRLTPED